MRASIVVILVVGACACATAAPDAPAAWRETRVDGSWRDTPARLIIEEVARTAGLRAIFEADAERQLDAARITLLSRKQPAARLLRRIGELADVDLVVISGRLVAYEHGRVPSMLIVANELAPREASVAEGIDAFKSRRLDCEWIDLTVGAICGELSRAFGAEVTVAQEISRKQELVSVSGLDLSLEDAVKEVCRQLECPWGFVAGGVVIGREGSVDAAVSEPAAPEAAIMRSAPLRLSGEPLTWEDLAGLTKTRSGRDVILAQGQRDRSLGRLWADGDAMDILIARALWEPGPLSAEITGATLALHPMGEEGSDEP